MCHGPDERYEEELTKGLLSLFYKWTEIDDDVRAEPLSKEDTVDIFFDAIKSVLEDRLKRAWY